MTAELAAGGELAAVRVNLWNLRFGAPPAVKRRRRRMLLAVELLRLEKRGDMSTDRELGG